MPNIFGSDDPKVHSGNWIGPQPPDNSKPSPQGKKPPYTPLVRWCRNTAATLKQENSDVLEEMRRNTNLSRGGTPWWRERPRWKIGTKLNYCASIPLTWTAILTDAKPSVSYSALDHNKQDRADIATAAWNQAFDKHNYGQRIHDAVLVSRVQKVAYLSLRPRVRGDKIEPILRVFSGEQVLMDRNARCVDDAEVIHVEYRESYGSLCERFENLRGKLTRKYDSNRDQNEKYKQSQLAPPGTYATPASDPSLNGPGGGTAYQNPTAYTPPYAASPNPPDGSGGSGGFKVEEFWTRPNRTVEIDEVRFLTSGVPATKPKMYETADAADEEPLRRIITEGDVIYELPESLVNDLHILGVIAILSDKPALEAQTHPVKYPLYPDGRLVVIVDDDVLAEDCMNPLGYIPLAEIKANADPGGGQHGPSDVDLIADVYEQLVRFVSLVYDNANLSGNSIWRIPENASISNDDITNAPGSIQREDLNTLKYGKREKAPDMPNYIPSTIKFLVEQIKELSGLSDMMTGKIPPKAQISTDTFTQNQEASGVRFRDALANLTAAMKTLGDHFLEFMARFYTSPVIVQVKNDAGVMKPTPMLAAYLTEPFIVEAKAGSRQPAGPSARLTTLLNLKNAGVPLPLDTVFALLEELGSVPSATQALRQIEQYMADPRQRWKLLGMAPADNKQSKKPNSRRSRKSSAAA